MARQTSLAHLFNLLTTLLKGEEELRRSPLPRLSLEILLLKLVSLEPLLDLPDWLERLTDLETRLEAKQPQMPAFQEIIPTPGAHLAREAPPDEERHNPPQTTGAALEPPPVDEGRWLSFLDFVKKKGGIPLAGKLHDSHFLKQENGCLHITPAAAWRVAQPQHLEQLQTLAGQFFGRTCRLEIEPFASDDLHNQHLQSPRQLSLTEIKPLAEEIFGGTWLNASTQTSESQEES